MTLYTFYFSTTHKLRGFEKELAQGEVSELVSEGEVEREEDKITLETESSLDPSDIRNLTFFEKVIGPDFTVTPLQEYLNRLPKLSNGQATTLDEILHLQPNKREHNYLTHDFHSYKGKYYPQLVNGCVNAYGDDPDLVLDPFMGSGTTNLEDYLHGVNSVGIDLNPIAHLISRTKLRVLEEDTVEVDKQLKEFSEEIRHRLNHPELRAQQRLDNFTDNQGQQLNLDIDSLTSVLPSYNREYLESWFVRDTLLEICAILDAINDVENRVIADVLRVSLSNIIRKVSLQNDSQLRVNRLESPPRGVDVLNDFISEVEARRKSIEGFTRFGDDLGLGGADFDIVQGDTRDLVEECKLKPESVSYVLTSPPYATGLPYIDMQRLSIFLLDLMDKNDRRDFEWKMVGNREINQGQRQELEAEFLEGEHNLPDSVTSVIQEIYERNLEADVGFRRRNKASLIYKYFRDMETIFDGIFEVLRPGGKFTYVVGNNTTRAGDKQVNIFNDELLLDTARDDGFELIDRIEMTHQQAHRAHSKNKIDQESIVTVAKPD